MRTKISERNVFPNFSIKKEYDKLNDLFLDPNAFSVLSYSTNRRKKFSYFELLRNSFRQWDLRGSATYLEEMMVSLQICEDDFANDASTDRMLDYIQFLFNAISFLEYNILKTSYNVRQEDVFIGKSIIENCYYLLDKLDAEIKREHSEWFVVYKKDLGAAVSIQQPELKVSIVEYLKIDNRYDLKRKSEILCSLAKDLEAHKESLSTSGQLYSDTKFLLNKSGIRHDFNLNDKQEAHFFAMNEKERIKWCDRTFEMILACMAELPYLEYKDEIQEIRRIK